MRQIKVVTFLLFSLWAKNLFATAQIGDRLVIKGDTVWINSNPLECYFAEKGKRNIGDFDLNNQEYFCTALWRGYVATWKLENDSLFLIRIQTEYCEDNPKEINIKSEFGSNRVFAQWVTDTIVSPQGELLQYVHMGYESIYEGEKYYTFKQGKLIDTKEINYLEKDDVLLFPGRNFLHETIKDLILNSISKIERSSFDERESCFLKVIFNKNREISYIGFGREAKNINEEIILGKAKEVLNGLPKLMKVNHPRYNLLDLEINIYFSGFNIHNDLDKVNKKDKITNIIFEKIQNYKWKKLEEFDCSAIYRIRISKKGRIDLVEMDLTKGEINEEYEKKEYKHCIRSIKKALKGLKFDKSLIEKYVYIELWFNDDGTIERWDYD